MCKSCSGAVDTGEVVISDFPKYTTTILLDKQSKIYVAGHNGLVDSAIWNNLLQRGYTYLA